jgi:hypothetical protein
MWGRMAASIGSKIYIYSGATSINAVPTTTMYQFDTGILDCFLLRFCRYFGVVVFVTQLEWRNTKGPYVWFVVIISR